MNRGYAFGFLLVILVVILGFYVALTGFQSGREAWRAQATPVRSTEVAQAAPQGTIPITPAPTAVVTSTLPLTATAELTATIPLTATVVAVATEASTETATEVGPAEPAETEPPIASPTAPPAAAPTQSASTPQVQPPTPAPQPGFQFRLGGPYNPDPSHPCCYIFGSVQDANGIGIPGIRVQVTNEWATQPIWAETKGGAEAGLSDIPLGYDAITLQIMVVDPGGNQISTKVEIPFDPCMAGGYRVDWQRTY